MTRPFRGRHRQAFTLIDAVSMLLIIGLVLSLAAVVLKASFGVQGQAVQYLIDSTSLQAAHQRFLKDVHRATEVTVEDESQYAFLVASKTKIERPPSPGRRQESSMQRPVLVLKVEDQTVMFRTVEDGIQRLVASEEKLVARDNWRLADKATATWSVIDGEVSMVRCDLGFEGSANPSTFWLARCLAVPTSQSSNEASSEGDE